VVRKSGSALEKGAAAEACTRYALAANAWLRVERAFCAIACAWAAAEDTAGGGSISAAEEEEVDAVATEEEGAPLGATAAETRGKSRLVPVLGVCAATTILLRCAADAELIAEGIGSACDAMSAKHINKATSSTSPVAFTSIIDSLDTSS